MKHFNLEIVDACAKKLIVRKTRIVKSCNTFE